MNVWLRYIQNNFILEKFTELVLLRVERSKATQIKQNKTKINYDVQSDSIISLVQKVICIFK